MHAEIIMAIASVSGTAIVAVGLVATWRRNGREQRERDEEMAKKQHERDKELEMGYQAIVKRLDDENTGLGSLGRKIENLKTNCAEVTGRYDERIISLERDMNNFKSG